MKAVVAAFNQEKALVGAFSVITNLRMDLFEAQVNTASSRVRAQRRPNQSNYKHQHCFNGAISPLSLPPMKLVAGGGGES